jgi:hypothetical protein
MENSDLLDGLIASAARHSRRSIVLSRVNRPRLLRHPVEPYAASAAG